MARGITSVLAFNTNGIAPNFSANVADLVSDLQVDWKMNQSEASVRREPMQTFSPTNFALTLTGKIRKDTNNAVFNLLRAAFLAQSLLDVLVLDGPLTRVGAEGVRFQGMLFGWGEDQGLGQGAIFKEFTIQPTPGPIVPNSVLVDGAGVLQFTVITQN
jgi:hypothetical protein